MPIDPELTSTVRVGELPTGTLSLTDKIPREKDDAILYQGTLQELLDLFRPLVGKLAYEAVTMIVDAQYIIDNFDLTPGVNMGLGINLCEGFAIRNGNNGTDNADGRVDVAYGITFNAIGGIGGYPDTVVVSHSHGLSQIKNNTNNGGPNGFYDRTLGGASTTYTTDSTGVSGVGKNYQPYRVVLKMMKLP